MTRGEEIAAQIGMPALQSTHGGSVSLRGTGRADKPVTAVAISPVSGESVEREGGRETRRTRCVSVYMSEAVDPTYWSHVIVSGEVWLIEHPPSYQDSVMVRFKLVSEGASESSRMPYGSMRY
jgi:hypothetical protein